METKVEMEDTYYLQEECLDPDSEDDFAYNEVSVDDADDILSGEEDLTSALQNVSTTVKPSKRSTSISPVTNCHPEVVEDFVRNYLVRNGLLETAESFQREWYQQSHKGKLEVHQTQHLPDVYAQNRSLECALDEANNQLTRYKEAARLAKEKYVRVQKERDYHRMHHRRVVQEKHRLLSDIKRMKTHLSTYEPVLQQLKQKYQTVTKEKMLACLERDRAVSEVGCLQTTLQSVQHDKGASKTSGGKQKIGDKAKPTNEVPSEPTNPHRASQLPVCAHLTRTAGFQPSGTLTGHEYAVTSLALHPTKALLVTASDDHTWKMWTIPSGDLLLSGEGHCDWISSVEFHPNGSRLASTSGDGTVKLWDFQTATCVHTFTEHQQPVWGCSWHWGGVFLASGGMDHTAKLWDVNRCVCVTSLRGHADSINATAFLPYTNTLLTASSDKTLSLWDIRTGLCTQTYYGHSHSCNDIQATLQGYDVFSCDCFGGVIQWDLRTHTAARKWDLGPFSINAMTVDPAGALVCCASDDSSVKIVDTGTDKEWTLKSGDNSVQDVLITRRSDMLLSADNTGTVTIWQ